MSGLIISLAGSLKIFECLLSSRNSTECLHILFYFIIFNHNSDFEIIIFKNESSSGCCVKCLSSFNPRKGPIKWMLLSHMRLINFFKITEVVTGRTVI